MRTAVFLFLFGDPLVSAFLSPHSYRPAISRPLSYSSQEVSLKPFSNKPCPSRVPPLMASDNEQEQSGETTIASSSDQLVLGLGGTTAALITFYSEYTLKTTGCGLPAGPFGLVGLVEGLSYLGVTGVVAFSLVKKIKTVWQ